MNQPSEKFTNCFKIFLKLLKDKWLIYVILLIFIICLKISQLKGEIMWILFFVIFLSLVIQSIFSIKKNYGFYIFKFVLIVLFCFELIFGLLNKKNVFNEHANSSNYIIGDSILHYKIRPNCIKERSNLLMGKDTVYDVYYTSDEYGRRIPYNEKLIDSVTHKKHAIFLGCSFTFGDGLDDSSTFPFIFQKNYNAYKSYNYGVSGYAPNQISLLFDKRVNTINNISVPQDSGFCLYTFIDDHLNRVYGSSEYLFWGSKTPDVTVENNNLIWNKRPFYLLAIAWILNNSETMKYFKIKNTYPHTYKFYKKFADLINYMAHKYLTIKPKGVFYVGLYPGNSIDTNWLIFLDKKIKILNIKQPNDYQTNESYMNKKFWHPKKALNEYYSSEVSKRVLN